MVVTFLLGRLGLRRGGVLLFSTLSILIVLQLYIYVVRFELSGEHFNSIQTSL